MEKEPAWLFLQPILPHVHRLQLSCSENLFRAFRMARRVSPSHPRALHLQIPPSVDRKYLRGKNSRKFQSKAWNCRLLATVDVVITSDSQPITSTHTALGIRDPAMTKSVQEGTGASMDLLPDRPQTSRGDCISKGCHCPVILPRRNLDVRSLPKVTDNQKTYCFNQPGPSCDSSDSCPQQQSVLPFVLNSQLLQPKLY